MLKSIATVSLSGTLPQKLEAAALARFDAVEIFENDLINCRNSPAEIRRLAADLGLATALYQPFRDYEAAARDRFELNLRRAERKFDVMEELGATTVLVCSAVAPDTGDDDDLAAADLRQLAERAARRGLKIGYEALAWGKHVKDYRHAWRIVELADHPSLGLILDSFHTLAIGDDLAGLADIPGDRIFMVQVADAPRLHMDPLSWSRHHRCFPGQGQLDVAGFLAPIVSAGYGGPLSLEVFNDDFRSASPRQGAADGMRALQYLEEETASRIAGGDKAQAAGTAKTPVNQVSVHADLFRPPAPPSFGGIEFLEFAVDDESSGRLAPLFEGLGFELAGRHRSKNVSLFRQSGINLILNGEADSFAHSFFLAHGPSVCALAFGVDDAGQALNRARAYHCQPFDSKIGTGEQFIPAVRQPDGSLVYLVENNGHGRSIFETDFVLDALTPQRNDTDSLLRIDHISIALPPGQLDTWTLFYKSVFGFGADDTWFLPDPYGFVRSRAMRSRDGTVRIPLSIATGRSGAGPQPIAAYGGPGIQHIALATDDIVATAQRLRRGGVSLLEISPNYYADLAAKYDLDEEFLSALQSHNILYDRSGDGEFLQLYTGTFEDRFFFEIVERRGYKDYGAVNAPVRMAAQTQTTLPAAVEAWAQAL